MINSELNFKLEDVLPNFSNGLQKKILYSIDLLQKAERLAMAYDSENGYFLAFSGGKDSQCLYHVAKLAGVKFQAHMNLTSVDPPEVIRFVKKQYPDVVLAKPKDSIYNIAVQRKILPTMRVRWCCAEYKETAGAGKVTLIGIRHAESTRRAKRNEVEINNHSFSGDLLGLEAYRKEKTEKANRSKKKPEHQSVTIVNADGERTLGCIHGKESLLISPIIHWSESDVWEFLNVLGIAHCELYDQGFRRIGCILCPMSQPKQKRKEIERWPHVKRGWIKAIKAIRNGGGGSTSKPITNSGGGYADLQGRLHLVEHQVRHGAVQECQRDAQDGEYEWRPNTNGYFINGKAMRAANAFTPPQKNQRTNRGLWAMQDPTFASANNGCANSKTGFSESSSSDRLTEEQENEIAENIFDWWISGKSYKKWYSEKFLQQKLNFEED